MSYRKDNAYQKLHIMDLLRRDTMNNGVKEFISLTVLFSRLICLSANFGYETGII